MIDERFYTDFESLKADFSVVAQKLESKSQAVMILNTALKKCQAERDEFKRMAEQVMNRYQLLRKTVSQDIPVDGFSTDVLSQLPSKQLAALLVEGNEANKGLQLELNQLKARLCEANGDIDLLRKQLLTHSPELSSSRISRRAAAEKQRMVSHMEKLIEKINELEHELSQSSDEKAELVAERDIYRNKCDRLNNELNYVLSGDERKLVDIDALIMERKALRYRLKNMEEEKRLAMATLSKYKTLSERRASKTSVSSEGHVSSTESPTHNGLVVTGETSSHSSTPSSGPMLINVESAEKVASHESDEVSSSAKS